MWSFVVPVHQPLCLGSGQTHGRLQVYTTLEGGGILWNASGVLGEYLAAKRKEDIAGKHVLEVLLQLLGNH